ncbi:hypothetical protein BMS3Abin05_01503 [bacterium BMS3Abin05]|nr:hypothetical protein BMS3Abin05_01503 [bacterium BMS3Abin05]GBE27063.1 hypothetical protein BMS3Bbin03_00983 [bacterium BMS3Bbin03]
MKKLPLRSRWKKAQQYEEQWWASRIDRIDLEYYRAYAERLKKLLSTVLDISTDTFILEVGSGAAGILTFLESKHKIAIDPLEDFFASIKPFSDFRDKRVNYFKGRGETLPFKDSLFNLVIMDNVLDHCDQPKRVLSEVQRVLKKGGVVYFRQNVYHIWGKIIRTFLENFEIDRGHPHSFTGKELKHSFDLLEIKILKTERTGYWKSWYRLVTSKNLKSLAKAFTFAAPDTTVYILEK